MFNTSSAVGYISMNLDPNFLHATLEHEKFVSLTQSIRHIETSQFICTANQLTGFYMRRNAVINGLKTKLKE